MQHDLFRHQTLQVASCILLRRDRHGERQPRRHLGLRTSHVRQQDEVVLEWFRVALWVRMCH